MEYLAISEIDSQVRWMTNSDAAAIAQARNMLKDQGTIVLFRLTNEPLITTFKEALEATNSASGFGLWADYFTIIMG